MPRHSWTALLFACEIRRGELRYQMLFAAVTATVDMSILSNYSRHAQRFRAPQERLPGHYRATILPVMFLPMYSA